MRKYVLRFLIIYKRIANAYTRCRRITNPTERVFASSNIIYKRIANAYTRYRRITNPTKRLFNVPLDLWSLAKQECSARPPVPARLDLQSDRNEYKHF